MAITRPMLVDDDGTGNAGTVLNNAWLQNLLAYIDERVAEATKAAADAKQSAVEAEQHAATGRAMFGLIE